MKISEKNQQKLTTILHKSVTSYLVDNDLIVKTNFIDVPENLFDSNFCYTFYKFEMGVDEELLKISYDSTSKIFTFTSPEASWFHKLGSEASIRSSFNLNYFKGYQVSKNIRKILPINK